MAANPAIIMLLMFMFIGIGVVVYFFLRVEVKNVDCEVGFFGVCDPITKIRTRSVLVKQSGTGEKCDNLTEACVPAATVSVPAATVSVPAATVAVPAATVVADVAENCIMSNWSGCFDGVKTRTIRTPAKNGGSCSDLRASCSDSIPESEYKNICKTNTLRCLKPKDDNTVGQDYQTSDGQLWKINYDKKSICTKDGKCISSKDNSVNHYENLVIRDVNMDALKNGEKWTLKSGKMVSDNTKCAIMEGDNTSVNQYDCSDTDTKLMFSVHDPILYNFSQLKLSNGSNQCIKTLDSGDQVVSYTCSNDDKFRLNSKGQLVSKKTGKCLRSDDGGNKVIQGLCSEAPGNNELWWYDAQNDNTGIIKNRGKWKCMKVDGSSISNNAEIHLGSCDLENNNSFDIKAVRDPYSPIRFGNNRCIDIPAFSQDNISIQTYVCNNKANQMFKFDDSKRLVAKHSGKCLQAESQSVNAIIKQQECSNDPKQVWTVYTAGGVTRLLNNGSGIQAMNVSDLDATSSDVSVSVPKALVNQKILGLP